MKLPDTKLIDLEAELGERWVRSSLIQGFCISDLTSGVDLRTGRFRVIAPESAIGVAPPLTSGGVTSLASANDTLAAELDRTRKSGSKAIIIENDTARKGDQSLNHYDPSYAYVGENVLHWVDLRRATGVEAVRNIRAASTGYPLNSIVLTESPDRLGLQQGKPVRERTLELPPQCIRMIIVDAFDAESFVIWEHAR